jgi:hypothetical protein
VLKTSFVSIEVGLSLRLLATGRHEDGREKADKSEDHVLRLTVQKDADKKPRFAAYFRLVSVCSAWRSALIGSL